MIKKTLQTILLSLAVAAFSGCRREGIRVYTAPKDRPVEMAAHDHNGHAHGEEMSSRPRPEVTWQLPAGWKQTAPGRMSVAAFSIEGADGRQAQVAITPMPMLAGRELELVNMFREQVGMPALTNAEETARELHDVQVGSGKGKLFEVASRAESGEEPTRIITVMAHRPDSSWFYKLSGDPSVVEAQRSAFLEFLKSISIKEAPAGAGVADETASSGRNWKIPADWTEVAAGQMQVARFAVPAKNGAKAEVFVSVFPNDTGGTLANVNRWRRQLQLGEIGEGELSAAARPVEGSPGAILTDITNPATKQQLIGAIVPRDGQYWFYKLMGAAEAVTPQRDNFIRFIQSPP